MPEKCKESVFKNYHSYRCRHDAVKDVRKAAKTEKWQHEDMIHTAEYAITQAEREVVKAAKAWCGADPNLSTTGESVAMAVKRLVEAEDKLAALKGGK